MAPLYQAIAENPKPFLWTEQLQAAFDKTKEVLAHATSCNITTE